MIIRHYREQDREGCLAIFDANVPRFFAPNERADYADFLEQLPGRYYVMCDDDGTVIGCGGVAVADDPSIASMTWGMVHPHRHGQRLGLALAEWRLRQVAAMPEITMLKMDTSHQTVGFFKKLGFEVVRYTPDGYGEGLHRYDLVRAVDEDFRRQWA